MSSSSEFSSLTVKSAEKPSTFSQTCSLLSQYLKEKGSVGDPNLGMTCNADTNDTLCSLEMCRQRSTITMDLFPLGNKSGNMSTQNTMTATPQSWDLRSMNLFPQKTAPGPFLSEENVLKMAYANSSVVDKPAAEENKTLQMTIFYAGQVYVFDDFPADKVKDVMSLATKSSCLSNHRSVARKMVSSPVNPSSPVSTNINSTASTAKDLISERSQQQPTIPVVHDLPIARKASLHRFLEKRKDRIASKAPYQTSSPVSVSDHKKPASEGKPCDK